MSLKKLKNRLKAEGVKFDVLCAMRIPTKLDSDSTGSWTRIPGQAGQSVRSDAGRSGFTRVMSLGSSCRASA